MAKDSLAHQIECRTVEGRLRQARIEAGWKRPIDFAREYQINYHTYYNHETGRHPLTLNSATLYAQFLNVAPAWILTGDTSQRSGGCRIVGEVGGGNGRVTLFERKGVDLEVVPNADEHLDILAVRDDSYAPFAAAGDLVYFPLFGFNSLQVHGADCVVRLQTGQMLIRQVIVQANGLATLFAHNAPPMINVAVDAASIVAVVRKAKSLKPLRQRTAA